MRMKQPKIPKKLGERLRAERARRGLSLAQVAHEVGVALGTLSFLERGVSDPKLSTAEAVERWLANGGSKA
jgi:transcriptional regulator with XRE-family HTH domain